MNIFDKDVEYIQSVLKNRELMESEEFRNWIASSRNKELFNEYMAYREALLRQKRIKAKKVFQLRRIAAIALGAAAIISLVFLITPGDSNDLQETTKDIRVFTANKLCQNVTITSNDIIEEITKDSVMDIRNQSEVLSDKEIRKQTITTPRGKDFQIILCDGTKVWINAESTLTYPVQFNKDERRVELKGEAFFEVAKDKECPFIVCACGIETTVLGTRFNIHSYSEDDRHVTLVDGKVKVTNRETNKSSILLPGQDLSYTIDGEEIISRVNTDRFTAWTEGMFYFDDAPIEEIIQSIGRWYNVNIDLQDNKVYNIHLNFWANRNETIENVLQLLNKLGKVKAEYKDNTIHIVRI